METNDKDKNVQDQTGAQGASGANDASEGGTSKEGQQQQQTGGTPEKTFTQEQVNRMMAREKKQGRSAAFQELGINPEDAKMMQMFKAFVESMKTDEQKAQEQQAQANAATAAAEQRAMIAEAKAEAMQLGAQAQYVDDVVTLAISKMSDGADLKTVVGELKTKYPIWFAESGADDGAGDTGSTGGQQATGQKGTGSSLKGSDKNKGGEQATGLGKRLAAQRKATAPKKSFWG